MFPSIFLVVSDNFRAMGQVEGGTLGRSMTAACSSRKGSGIFQRAAIPAEPSGAVVFPPGNPVPRKGLSFQEDLFRSKTRLHSGRGPGAARVCVRDMTCCVPIHKKQSHGRNLARQGRSPALRRRGNSRPVQEGRRHVQVGHQCVRNALSFSSRDVWAFPDT